MHALFAQLLEHDQRRHARFMVVQRCLAYKSKSYLFFHYHGLEFESEFNLLQRAVPNGINVFFWWNTEYWLVVNAQVVKVFVFSFLFMLVRVWVRVREC